MTIGRPCASRTCQSFGDRGGHVPRHDVFDAMDLEMPEIRRGIRQAVDVTDRDRECRLYRAGFVLVADGEERSRRDAGHEEGGRQRKSSGNPSDLCRGEAGSIRGDGRAGRGRNPVPATIARAFGVWRNRTKAATADAPLDDG